MYSYPKLTIQILRVGLYKGMFAAAGIAQSVWRITTGWTVRDLKPGGGEFSLHI